MPSSVRADAAGSLPVPLNDDGSAVGRLPDAAHACTRLTNTIAPSARPLRASDGGDVGVSAREGSPDVPVVAATGARVLAVASAGAVSRSGQVRSRFNERASYRRAVVQTPR
jgi:hypothetical protein